jgi:uncharacterized repeat protein (TIGR01451 family)
MVAVAPSASAAGPAFGIKTSWGPTYLPPGGEAQFAVQARNLGETDPTEPVVVTDELPEGTEITNIDFMYGFTDLIETPFATCSGVGTRIATCELLIDELPPFLVSLLAGHSTETASSYLPEMFVDVSVEPGATGEAVNVATVSEGGELRGKDTDMIKFSSENAPFGPLDGTFKGDVFDDEYPAGNPARTAGDHPYELRVNFDLNTELHVAPDGTHETRGRGALKTVEVTLPRGVIGNPEALPKCDPEDFAQIGAFTFGSTQCPSNTQVGMMKLHLTFPGKNHGMGTFFNRDSQVSRVAIYNLEPPKGVAADFGFSTTITQGHIYAELDPAQNYAIKTLTPNITSVANVRGAEVTFWGVPGDPRHDKWRYFPKETEDGRKLGAEFDAVIQPLLTNPMDCGFANGGSRARFESYTEPGKLTPVVEDPSSINVTGCEDPRIRFEPKVEIQPDNQAAGGPTGLDVHLKVPQRSFLVTDANDLYAANGAAEGIGTPPMKKAVVTFPEGMTLSTSAAQGLGSCSSAQISLGTNKPVTCPDNSQYGKLILHTPILPVDHQPEGFIYIAKQSDNPFHNFLSVYLVIQEPEKGILVKIPGKLELDGNTGRITVTFDDLPQFPVSDMEMRFKGGVRAGLVNPTTCGSKTIRAEFFSWAAPTTPVVSDSGYDITQRPNGAPCVQRLGDRQFEPALDAGTANPIAGSYSPFVFKITRTDEDQEFSQLGVKLPPGLAAKFAGVATCTEAGIQQALSRETVPGGGALEQASPSCPQASQIGTTMVGTGVGVPLSWVPGKVYLAGPYKGAPMSFVVISPAMVGPYDLGVIAVRTAVNVNPRTAQGEATTDPFPLIFQGIPVRLREIRMELDRPGFMLNPTNCEAMKINAHVTGTGGDLASTADDTGKDLASRFQAADCASLDFRPRLSLRVFGAAHRGAHPKLQATLTMPPGQANIASASVRLPHSEFLDQGHIRTVCTRVQFAQDACPAGSVYGSAKAVTPLFDQPLSGPVYLRSSDHQLPDLVAVLRGPDAQPVEVELSSRIDSVNGGIRNSFELVPDAPVTKFQLTMKGGKKGLLVNSTNICLGRHRATAAFDAQNGDSKTLRPVLKASCGKKAAKKNGRGH